VAREESALQRFDKLKRAAEAARLPFDREGWLNLAFYLDEQYVTWDDKASSIRRIDRPQNQPNLPRPIVNKIMHYVQQEKAMVLQAKPTVDVMPATDDYMDLSHAGVAKSYLNWVSDPQITNFNRQLGRAVLWAIICNEGYLKWIWNPRLKQPEILPLPPFEVWADPYASDFAKARYIGHSKFMDVEQVQEMFPGQKIQAGKEEQADPMRTSLLRGMGSAPVVNGVTLNELWYRPCAKYPKGLYAVWANNQMLQEPVPLPYAHQHLPFTQIGCIERPDSQHYMSPVKYLRSAQMQLNKYHAQRIMIRETFSNPKWWIPAELELEAMPNDSPHQILRGQSMNGLYKPEIIQPSTYPPNDDGQMIETQMMNIVGLHEVSQAQVPGRVEAAKAIEMLKESDSDRQATMLDTITASISEGFWQILMLAKQFESPERMVQTYSREGLPEVNAFRAEKISPAMRIMVTMGTGLARSRAARQDQLQQMWDAKIITDPELMAELMEVPFPSFQSPKALDMRLARNENLVMEKGTPMQPNSWDDHTIHLREHNDFRKTHEFSTLPEKTKSIFEFHCTQHEVLQKQALQKQAELMALMQPQQPAPGGAPAGAAQPPPDTATQGQ
jgi:hypothetical protein